MTIEIGKMNCIIDTIQVRTDVNNIKDYFEKIELKQYLDYITPKASRVTAKGFFSNFVINLNNKCGYSMIKSLGHYDKELEETMRKMEILNVDEVELKRIDIAIDSPLDFFDNFKFFSLLFELCVNSSVRKGSKKSWYTVSFENLQNNTLKLDDNTYEIEFYDKDLQSGGRHMYNTRMEFRLLRRVSGISKGELLRHLNAVIEKLEHIDGYLPILECSMVKRLIALWGKEQARGKITKFSDFVLKYDDYFYTKNVFDEVYKVSGLNQGKTAVSNWLKNYRRTSTLTFYCKSDIVNQKKEMIKAIKGYIKGIDK